MVNQASKYEELLMNENNQTRRFPTQKIDLKQIVLFLDFLIKTGVLLTAMGLFIGWIYLRKIGFVEIDGATVFSGSGGGIV